MARDVTVMLERISCAVEHDGSGASEPYVWPALILIDDTTIATSDVVRVLTPAQSFARVGFGSSMKAGDVRQIPSQVGVLRMRIEDDLLIQKMILVLVLQEEDDTPDKAVKAAFAAFGPALRAAIGSRLAQLAAADETTLPPLIDEIVEEVDGVVSSAGEDALSAGEKVRVFLGLLNLDDTIGNAFQTFDPIESTALSFLIEKRTSGGALDQSFTIDGQFQVRPVPVEMCPAEAAAVKAAQAMVKGIEDLIRSLQDELQTASPSLKPFLVSEIRRLRREDLSMALDELEAAQAALAACRARHDRFHDIVVEQDGILVATPN